MSEDIELAIFEWICNLAQQNDHGWEVVFAHMNIQELS